MKKEISKNIVLFIGKGKIRKKKVNKGKKNKIIN
jgi:hypothetical protein